MPIQSIDWPRIKEKYAGGTVLVAMTDRQLALLNSLQVQLKWRKTFRVDGYDFSDLDALEQEIDDLGVNINMPVYLTDLLTALSDIKGAIDAIQAVQDYCCTETDPTGGLQYVTPFTEGGSNEVPQVLVDAGYATDVNDWDGFYQYQCGVANLFVDNLKWQLDQMQTLFDYGGALIAGVGALATIFTIVTGGSGLLLVGIIVGTAGAAGLFSQLQSLGQVGLPSSDDIEDIRDDLVCAWVNPANDGFEDRWDAWVTALHDGLNEAAAYFCESMSMKSTMRPLYAGQLGERSLADEMAEQGWDPNDYTCPCLPDAGCDASNELTNCSFQSGALDNGWAQVSGNGASIITTPTPYEGTYALNPGGIGWPDQTKYVYQNFTASASGTVRFKVRQLYRTGLYNNIVSLYRWNGSAWVAHGSYYVCTTTHDGIWNLFNQVTDWSVTAGTLYQLRYGLSYQYADNLQVIIE